MTETEVNPEIAATQDAASIAPIGRDEASALAEAELERFLALVDTLSVEDWTKPTACTEWDVRQILAHQSGCNAGLTNWTDFRRQYIGAMVPRGKLLEDAVNATQVSDRANKTPAELIAELRGAGRRAIANRGRIPLPVRVLAIPYPIVGLLRVGYLLDIIYSRDMWMHRIDIARATGRAILLTPEHDGRLVALVVRDLATTLAPKLDGQSVVFDLTGPAGGAWRIGPAAQPAAAIHMDAIDFNILASGRYTTEQGLARAEIHGDRALAEKAMRRVRVLY